MHVHVHVHLPCRWDTFCNHLDGEWVGQYGAYTPWEGARHRAWLRGWLCVRVCARVGTHCSVVAEGNECPHGRSVVAA